MRDALVDLLRGVERAEAAGHRVAVIGGLARGVWATPRATMDVDILIDATDLAAIEARASEWGLWADPDEVRGLAGSGMTRLRVPRFPKGPIRLDVLSADHPYYVRVLGRARRVDVLGVALPVACAEDILVLKHLADRAQDRADIEAILNAQRGRLDRALVEEECARLELEPLPGLAG